MLMRVVAGYFRAALRVWFLLNALQPDNARQPLPSCAPPCRCRRSRARTDPLRSAPRPRGGAPRRASLARAPRRAHRRLSSRCGTPYLPRAARPGALRARRPRQTPSTNAKSRLRRGRCACGTRRGVARGALVSRRSLRMRMRMRMHWWTVFAPQISTVARALCVWHATRRGQGRFGVHEKFGKSMWFPTSPPAPRVFPGRPDRPAQTDWGDDYEGVTRNDRHAAWRKAAHAAAAGPPKSLPGWGLGAPARRRSAARHAAVAHRWQPGCPPDTKCVRRSRARVLRAASAACGAARLAPGSEPLAGRAARLAPGRAAAPLHDAAGNRARLSRRMECLEGTRTPIGRSGGWGCGMGARLADGFWCLRVRRRASGSVRARWATRGSAGADHACLGRRRIPVVSTASRCAARRADKDQARVVWLVAHWRHCGTPGSPARISGLPVQSAAHTRVDVGHPARKTWACAGRVETSAWRA